MIFYVSNLCTTQNLVLAEKGKDLNVVPLLAAKRSLCLGRGLPLLASDDSGIRLHPVRRDTMYRWGIMVTQPSTWLG